MEQNKDKQYYNQPQLYSSGFPPNQNNPNHSNHNNNYNPYDPQNNLNYFNTYNNRVNPNNNNPNNNDYRQDQSNLNRTSKSSSESNPLSESTTRQGFIKKVFGIVFCQLLLTFLYCLLTLNVKQLAGFQLQNHWLFYVIVGLNLALSCVLLCCTDVAKRVPINYVLLLAFTLTQSYMVSFICAAYGYNADLTPSMVGRRNILIALGGTVGMTFILTVIAWTNVIDMTSCGFFMCMLGMMGIAFIPLIIIFPSMYTFYSWFMLVCFSLYLIYDVQLVLGKGSTSLSQQDYIVGALIVYIDIIQIFIRLLQIISN